MKSFIRNRSYDAEVELLKPSSTSIYANDPNAGPECTIGCEVCDKAPEIEGVLNK